MVGYAAKFGEADDRADRVFCICGLAGR